MGGAGRVSGTVVEPLGQRKALSRAPSRSAHATKRGPSSSAATTSPTRRTPARTAISRRPGSGGPGVPLYPVSSVMPES